jgi:uncharacterized protein (TIGR02145 family)
MITGRCKTRPIRICVSLIALSIAFESHATSWQRPSEEAQKASGMMYASKRMADGRQWMTHNVDVSMMPSYCYEDKELNCRQFGRLYTWESARRVCQSLGDGWQLPTNEEWRQLAKHYRGVRDDSNDGGKAAYSALVIGGSSGFNAVFGGGRSGDGQYARLNAHGFYWTASESGPGDAWLYNFGQARILNRHNDGEKQRAFSVRCVRP